MCPLLFTKTPLHFCSCLIQDTNPVTSGRDLALPWDQWTSRYFQEFMFELPAAMADLLLNSVLSEGRGWHSFLPNTSLSVHHQVESVLRRIP